MEIYTCFLQSEWTRRRWGVRKVTLIEARHLWLTVVEAVNSGSLFIR